MKRNNFRNLFTLLLVVLALYLLDNTKLNKYIGVKRAENLDVATERVANIIKGQKNIGNTDKMKIAIVSSECESYAVKCVDKLKQLVDQDIDLILAGDIMVSPEAVKVVSDIDYVILAESINESKYSVINDTCSQLNIWNKSILGIVLVN